MKPKKTFSISDAGLQPLKVKLKEDRDVSEVQFAEREIEIPLFSLVDKMDSDVHRMPSHKTIRSLAKQNRDNSYHVSISSLFNRYTSIPSTLCNKCIHNSTCPYFARGQVCQFIATYFKTGRYIHKFIPYVMRYVNTNMWRSSVFTNEQTAYDVLQIMFAVLCLVRVIKDQQKPDHAPLTYNGPNEDIHFGGRTRGLNFNSRVQDYKDKKRRDILNIPHVSSMNRRLKLDTESKINEFYAWIDKKTFE